MPLYLARCSSAGLRRFRDDEAIPIRRRRCRAAVRATLDLLERIYGAVECAPQAHDFVIHRQESIVACCAGVETRCTAKSSRAAPPPAPATDAPLQDVDAEGGDDAAKRWYLERVPRELGLHGARQTRTATSSNPLKCGRSSVVERQLPKLNVVGSIPIARSMKSIA